ncbi:MAG TPA: hypothetical protein VKV39_02470 [Candidatus Sulfotelmatobacter sp.]|nr:hypothetical protein [Candidatus Sulfotelmatobacter sp.]
MTRARDTQRERILALLSSRPGQWIGLPEILDLGFAQFGARILELRRTGHQIENKTEHRDGKVLSWYRLTPSAQRLKADPAPATSGLPTPPVGLFGDLRPERYPD